jgi:uncharacterized protein (DUF433 family)
MTTETLSEEEKTRRVPGIIFVDGAFGRVARVAGTGFDVWEVIDIYRAFGGEKAAILDGYPWVTPKMLNAALAYYDAFPEEIDARIALDESFTPETVYEQYPFMRPPWR